MSIIVEAPKPAPSAARLRQALIESVTEDDVRSVTKKLIELAKDGDLRAIRLLYHYSLGKPGDAIPNVAAPPPQKEAHPARTSAAFDLNSDLGDPTLKDLITRQIQQERSAESNRVKPAERKPMSVPPGQACAKTEAMSLINRPDSPVAATSVR